jgi:hypothetical protein
MTPENISLKVAIIGGVFLLVATLVGAFITTGFNYFLYRMRERAERERENRKRAIEIRRACRLIDAELLRADVAARICVEEKRWWNPTIQLTTEAWQNYSGIVSPESSYTDWVAVMVAVQAVDNLRSGRDIAFKDRLSDDIADMTAEQIVPVLMDIERGRRALTQFTLDQPPQHAGSGAY